MNARTLLLGITFGLAACSNPESPVVVQSLDLTAPKQTIGVGEAVQLVAVPRNPNGVPINSVRVNYDTSVPTVANVGTDGRVIGVSPGTAQITATAGQITQSLTFTVVPGNVAAVVTMQSNTFTPFRASIRAGQTVLWDFPADAHNVIFAKTATTGRPTDIGITSGVAVTRTFTTAGTFPYDCTLHPGMSGEVVVTP
jgi:plastocyanin